MCTLVRQQRKLVCEEKQDINAGKDTRDLRPLSGMKGEPRHWGLHLFRRLISIQPPQFGRVNMHYSEMPHNAVETEFKQNVGPAPKDLTTEIYFPSVKFRSHLSVVFYNQYFEHAKCIGEFGSKKGQERQTEEWAILPTTVMLSRLAGCSLKIYPNPHFGNCVVTKAHNCD
ncbi:PREDICTED: uncharacterized protein C5orf64 homolog, partial [Galeopterus variegatus]|uniref:Uncharacterized protein C5orf64 homolog n=1 Tax=Galeopterus variegatus TaxID=482537 RepID=A0ABM0R158_GALVR